MVSCRCSVVLLPKPNQTTTLTTCLLLFKMSPDNGDENNLIIVTMTMQFNWCRSDICTSKYTKAKGTTGKNVYFWNNKLSEQWAFVFWIIGCRNRLSLYSHAVSYTSSHVQGHHSIAELKDQQLHHCWSAGVASWFKGGVSQGMSYISHRFIFGWNGQSWIFSGKRKIAYFPFNIIELTRMGPCITKVRLPR